MYESGVYAVRCAWSHGEGVVGGKGKFEESRWISSMEMFGVLGCVLVCATVFFFGTKYLMSIQKFILVGVNVMIC